MGGDRSSCRGGRHWRRLRVGVRRTGFFAPPPPPFVFPFVLVGVLGMLVVVGPEDEQQ